MKDRRHDLRANRQYHERVAARYDDIYKGPRWDAWFELSWDGMKPHLPHDLRAPVADLGCGTGRYGLRLAKSGFTVTLSDLAEQMLEATRRKAAEMGVAERCSFVRADVMDLSALPREHFGLAVAREQRAGLRHDGEAVHRPREGEGVAPDGDRGGHLDAQ
jgi:ubiquinone/menaquinone biosynthesis C-methylase UbiE